MMIRPALDVESGTEGVRLRVRDPFTMKFLADEGEEKPASEYWLRRLRDGDVEQVEVASVVTAKKPVVVETKIEEARP